MSCYSCPWRKICKGGRKGKCSRLKEQMEQRGKCRVSACSFLSKLLSSLAAWFDENLNLTLGPEIVCSVAWCGVWQWCSTDSAHPKAVRSWSPAPTIALPGEFIPAASLTPALLPAWHRLRELQHKPLEKALMGTRQLIPPPLAGGDSLADVRGCK